MKTIIRNFTFLSNLWLCLLAASASATGLYPTTITLGTTNVTTNQMTMTGSVNPNGDTTRAWFQWGFTVGYGNFTSVTNLGGGSTALPVTNVLSGLVKGRVYHYRVVAANSTGTNYGQDRVFEVPVLTLLGANPLQVTVNTPFVDPGEAVTGTPLAIGGGYGNSMAWKADGQVAVWGNDQFGEDDVPAGATNLIALSSHSLNAMALRADGTVVNWGADNLNQTDNPPDVTNVVAIAASFNSIALKTDGTVEVWGYAGYGEDDVPTNSLNNPISIAAGDSYALAANVDGSVVAWGYNNLLQLNVPGSAVHVVQVSAGNGQSLALRADGTVVGWGENVWGETSPPASATNVIKIAAGGYHSVVLKGDGTAVAFGYDVYGETDIPAGLSNIVDIAASDFTSLFLQADGTLTIIGSNSLGETAPIPNVTNLTDTVTVSGSVNTAVVGTYTLTYTTTNFMGAVNTVTRTVVVTPPPVILSISNNVPGQETIRFTGSSLYSYTVHATTNVALPFANWQTLGAATLSSGNLFQYVDLNAGNFARRFYQVSSP